MKLSQILSLLGPGFILNSVSARLREGVTKPERLTPEIARLAAALLLEDPALPRRLREVADDHLLGDEIIRGVIDFLLQEGDARLRTRALEVARWFGHIPVAHKERPGGLDTLTASQQAAFREICALSEIYFDGGIERAGVELRIAPLVIGPSGVGKTHVVTAAGRAMGLPVIRLTVGDWIIQAARQPPCALEILQRNLDQHGRMILFIDELDKLTRMHGGGDYSLHQHVEIYAALDRSISFPGASGKPWTEEHAGKLRRNVMIVGGGTWHDLWLAGGRRPMGFGHVETVDHDIASRIRRARIIPEELLNRFSDRWLLLHPYTVEDFQAIAQRIGLAPEDFDPAAAVASGGNFRAVQNALTTRALKRHLAASARPPIGDMKLG